MQVTVRASNHAEGGAVFTLEFRNLVTA